MRTFTRLARLLSPALGASSGAATSALQRELRDPQDAIGNPLGFLLVRIVELAQRKLGLHDAAALCIERHATEVMEKARRRGVVRGGVWRWRALYGGKRAGRDRKAGAAFSINPPAAGGFSFDLFTRGLFAGEPLHG
jgi:hypothetical protein